jgi:serine/threonine protein kinase
LGIMIYRIIYSDFPHIVKDIKTFQSFCVSEREMDFPACSDYELYPLLSLAKKCLVKNYKNRMSAVELYKHTFSKYEEVCKLIIVDPFLDNEKTKTIREKYHTLKMSKGDEREVRSPRKSTPPPTPTPPIKKTTLVIQSSDLKIVKSYTVMLRPNEFTLNYLKEKRKI